MIADPIARIAMGVGSDEAPVAVTNQVTWRFIPGERVSHLPSAPLGIWIGSDADRDQPPARVTQDHQAIEQLERDRAHDEPIQRSDAGNVIAQEGLPTLGG